MSKNVRIDCFGHSDVGKERKVNQDQFLIADLNRSILVKQTTLSVDQETLMLGSMEGKLFVIADGAGGHASGERASELAVHAITHYALNTMAWFFQFDSDHENELITELQEGLEKTHEILYKDAESHPENRSMATTLTLAYVIWPRLYILHAGDSRTYIQRDSLLYQITQDHTYAEHHEGSPFAGVLWNALVADSSKEVKPEVHKAELQYGDTLLLCTDGLNKHVEDSQISKTLLTSPKVEDAAQALVQKANDGGGTDNVTVIVARFIDPTKYASG